MATLRRNLTFAGLLLATSGCSALPRELNLSPLWFHRCSSTGEVLEWDLLWPLVHYERTAEGGDDFRIRPLYRRVTEPPPQNLDGGAVEHQFLWPLGRVRSDAEESSQRLFPLWSWRQHRNQVGEVDVDWYLLFPFLWGGHSADQRENYFAFLPFYADIPEFLTYDRFRAVLFPLFVGLDKGGHRHNLWLWPLIGTSSCAQNNHERFHVYPFYGHDIEPGHHDRRFLLWPFFAWSRENLYTDAPVSSFWLWPLLGWRSGRTVGGWMALWPFFQHTWKQDHFTSLVLFWPLFRYYWNRAEDNVTQRWFWPFFGSVDSDDQRAWSLLWPLVWWRQYDDPDGRTVQRWILPFWWQIRQENRQDGNQDFDKLWPLAHHEVQYDTNGQRQRADWSVPSPFPWRGGNATGWSEAYGFLWEWIRGRQRNHDDHSLDVAARLYTERQRGAESSASVPFLWNYERDADGQQRLRLLQFLPIPLGRSAETAHAAQGQEVNR